MSRAGDALCGPHRPAMNAGPARRAPSRWPFREHRTMADVMAVELAASLRVCGAVMRRRWAETEAGDAR